MTDDRTEAIRANLRRDYGALIPAGGVQNQMLADLSYLLERMDAAQGQLQELQATLDAAGTAETIYLTVNGKEYEVEYYGPYNELPTDA